LYGGQWLDRPAGAAFKVSFTPLGVCVALIFIGLPFVVRTLQPVLEDLNRELEEAAATLGASRWQTFSKVILPAPHAGAADRLCAGLCAGAG
jgi:sulfate transport system permease protein